ncbi:hypothetical protein [Staphylococcus equorum]|uniref:hypothetical protein n=1 Tax=Staphylococcus equorum TaxID=246432 RepID=UPI002DBC5EB5|nr:hypothetical protein [Staphylococcus equorum]MEB7795436.1 hypothetical protein [Staphylococcus equorum]
MDIVEYLKSLNFNAIFYKLAEYEIGEKLLFDIGNLESEIQLAGGKQNYLNSVVEQYKYKFHDENLAIKWIENKQNSNIELYLLNFHCKY